MLFLFIIETNRVRKSTEQLHSSREQFERIAKNQADAMMVREKS